MPEKRDIRVPPDAPPGLLNDHWEFVVTDHHGRVWDIYHYKLDWDGNISPEGVLSGTLAYRYDERLDRWIMGIGFHPGHLTHGQALRAIMEHRL